MAKNYIVKPDVNLIIKEGEGKGKTIADIAKKYKATIQEVVDQVAKGMKFEKEHSDKPEIKQQIVMNHLWELGMLYYDDKEGLPAMEERLKNKISDERKFVEMRHGKTAFGNDIGAVIPPVKIKVIKPIGVRDLFISGSDDVWYQTHDKSIWPKDKLAKIESFKKATAAENYELIQFSHPSDYLFPDQEEYSGELTRMNMLKYWEENGEEIFKQLGLPIEKGYPYLSTGNFSIFQLFHEDEDIHLQSEYEYWNIADGDLPIAPEFIPALINILEGQLEKLKRAHSSRKKSIDKHGYQFEIEEKAKEIEFLKEYLNDHPEIISDNSKKKEKPMDSSNHIQTRIKGLETLAKVTKDKTKKEVLNKRIKALKVFAKLSEKKEPAIYNLEVRKTDNSPWEQLNEKPITKSEAIQMEKDYKKSGKKYHEIKVDIALFKEGGNLKFGEGGNLGVQASISRNMAKGGIEIRFSERAPEVVINYISNLGFRYSRFQKMYYTKYSDSIWEKVNDYFSVDGDGNAQPIPVKTGPDLEYKIGTIYKYGAQADYAIENAQNVELHHGSMDNTDYFNWSKDPADKSDLTTARKAMSLRYLGKGKFKLQPESNYANYYTFEVPAVIDWTDKTINKILPSNFNVPIGRTNIDKTIEGDKLPGFDTDKKEYKVGDKVVFQKNKFTWKGIIEKDATTTYTMRSVMYGSVSSGLGKPEASTVEHHKMYSYDIRLNVGALESRISPGYQMKPDTGEKTDEMPLIKMGSISIFPFKVWTDLISNVQSYHRKKKDEANARLVINKKQHAIAAETYKTKIHELKKIYYQWETANLAFSRMITKETEDEQTLRLNVWKTDLGIDKPVEKPIETQPEKEYPIILLFENEEKGKEFHKLALNTFGGSNFSIEKLGVTQPFGYQDRYFMKNEKDYELIENLNIEFEKKNETTPEPEEKEQIQKPVFNEEEVKKTIKQEFKKFMKEHYDIEVLKMSVAYKVVSGTTYIFRTDKPIPKELHSGWASPTTAQQSTRFLYNFMQKHKAKEKEMENIEKEEKGITFTIDQKELDKNNLKAQFILLYDREPTETELTDFIQKWPKIEPQTVAVDPEITQVIPAPIHFKGINYSYANRYEINRAIEEFIDAHTKKFTVPVNEIEMSSDDLIFISKYSGYGGLEKFGASGKGLLYEYFTPEDIIKKMWGLAIKYGYKEGPVLEPSVGVGRFIKYAPYPETVTGYEINKYSVIISQLLYPASTIIEQPFEKTFIKNNESVKAKTDNLQKYELIIGNPPYGDLGGKYFGMGEEKYTRAQNFVEYFITRGLDLLVKDGLLVYIVGAELVNGGSMFLSKDRTPAKEEIAKKAILVDAYRLPSGLFDNTGVTTEIIVLRKK